jgi:hypothetical protein
MSKGTVESSSLSELMLAIPDLGDMYLVHGEKLIPEYCVEGCELIEHKHIDGDDLSLFVIPGIEDTDELFTAAFRSDGRCIIISANGHLSAHQGLLEEDLIKISDMYSSDGRIYERRENSHYSNF